MKAYSIDLQTKIVQSVRKGVSKSDTARRFGVVNRSTVHRYLKRPNQSGILQIASSLHIAPNTV